MSLVLAVIPARFKSTRFPGKVLAPLGDKPLVGVVWDRVRACDRVDRLIVATEDAEVVAAAQAFGAETMLTASTHASGTDRLGEVLDRVEAEGQRPDVLLNVQGDEPCVTSRAIGALIDAVRGSDEPTLATLAEPVASVDELWNPNAVKVVRGANGRALYFSRSPIPYHRGDAERLETDFRPALESRGLAGYLKHQGIYAYSREAYRAMTAASRSPLESDEGLEQLRALEIGLPILVLDSDFRSVGVDTPEDLERARRALYERR